MLQQPVHESLEAAVGTAGADSAVVINNEQELSRTLCTLLDVLLEQGQVEHFALLRLVLNVDLHVSLVLLLGCLPMFFHKLD